MCTSVALPSKKSSEHGLKLMYRDAVDLNLLGLWKGCSVMYTRQRNETDMQEMNTLMVEHNIN